MRQLERRIRRIEDQAEYKLRVPESLKKELITAAQKNHRSLNREIAARLERTFAANSAGTANGETSR